VACSITFQGLKFQRPLQIEAQWRKFTYNISQSTVFRHTALQAAHSA